MPLSASTSSSLTSQSEHLRFPCCRCTFLAIAAAINAACALQSKSALPAPIPARTITFCSPTHHISLPPCPCVRRAKHQSRGAVYEQILKKNEQVYALLAVVTALCPTAARLLDEAVTNTLREK